MKKILNWEKFNENNNNHYLTAEEKNFIEDQLTNASELMSEEEMINWFIENEINNELANIIVKSEMSNFLTNPMYEIDWTKYINE